VTFLVALGLFGLFFGRRLALGVMALSLVMMTIAGIDEVQG